MHKMRLWYKAFQRTRQQNVEFNNVLTLVEICCCAVIALTLIIYMINWTYDALACYFESDFLEKLKLSLDALTLDQLCQRDYNLSITASSLFTFLCLISVVASLIILFVICLFLILPFLIVFAFSSAAYETYQLHHKRQILPLTTKEAKDYQAGVIAILYLILLLLGGLYLRYVGPTYDWLACSVERDFLGKTRISITQNVTLSLNDLCQGDYAQYFDHNLIFSLASLLALILLSLCVFGLVKMFEIVPWLTHILYRQYRETQTTYTEMVSKTV